MILVVEICEKKYSKQKKTKHMELNYIQVLKFLEKENHSANLAEALFTIVIRAWA